MKFRPLLVLSFLALTLQGEAQVLGARPFSLPPGAKPLVATVSNPLPRAGTVPPVTPATFRNRISVADGATVTKQIISFAQNAVLEIDEDRLNDWKPASSPQFAVLWTNWFSPQVRLGINYVTGPAARSLMNGTGWSSVPSALKRDAKDTVRVLVNDDSETNNGMISIFGWRTRVYQVEIASATPDTALAGQLIVVAGNEDRAYLFVLEGPARPVSGLERSFEDVLTRLQPPDSTP